MKTLLLLCATFLVATLSIYFINREDNNKNLIPVDSFDRAPVYNISVYPDPTADYLYVRSNMSVKKVEVYDQAGACVLAEHNFRGRLNVAALKEDIYYARIYIGNTSVVRKFSVLKL